MKGFSRITVALALGCLGAGSTGAQTPPWRDPGVVSINREAPRSFLDTGTEDEPDRWRLDLGGRWRFLYLDRVSVLSGDPAATLADDPRWTEIAVPGSWQEQGFGATVLARHSDQNPVYGSAQANPAGVYSRRFSLPDDWSGRRVILRLARVRASVSVYLNGASIGYSESGDVAVEFDLTDEARSAANLLTLVVTQWSTSSEHNAPHWMDAGLVGAVTLLALPSTSIGDVATVIDFDPTTELGTLDLRLWLRGTAAASRGAYRIEASISNPAGEILARRSRSGIFLAANGQASTALRLRLQPALAWSADAPTLYNLDLRLLGPDGSLVQSAGTRVGFRRVELGAAGLVVNGQPEVLRGVSLDADLPLRVDEGVEIERHLALMKRAGINALRLPTALGSRWMDLLDEYGFYAIHDLVPGPLPTGAASSGERARAMVESAKIHPSTFAWAVNDGDPRASEELRAWLRQRDRTHPVLPNATLNVVAKPRAWQLARRAERAPTLLFLWPFGSLLGNSGGGLQSIWAIVDRQPGVIGGFLPHWMVSARTESEDLAAAEPDAIARGLLDSGGRPLPQYAVVADLYRRLHFEVVDRESARFRLVNRSNSFVDTGTRGRWALRQDGSVVAAGRLPHLGVGAGESVDFTVPGLPARAAPAEYHVSLTLADEPGSEPGTELAVAQFELSAEQPPSMETYDAGVPDLALDADGSRLELTTRDVTFRIDRTSGTLRYLGLRGRPLVNDVVRPALWRMPTQLERANGLEAVDARLRGLFSAAPAEWVGRRVSPGAHSSVSEYTLLDEGLMRLQTTVHGTGAAELNLHWLGERGIADPPRLGIDLPLGPQSASVEWFGRGPGESYVNRTAGTEIGRWQLPLPLEDPYHWVQAHGLRSEVRWLTVWFSDGSGLLIVTPPTSAFSVSSDGGASVVHLDARHRGVGGERDDAVPPRIARVPPGEYRVTFLLLPLPAGADPQQLFRRQAPTDETAAALGRQPRTPTWRLGHLAQSRPLNLVESNADVPPTLRSALNDGWIGTVDAFDRSWQPLDSMPAEITIDLERIETVRRIRLGVLASRDACADLPGAVEFSYSTDRRRWASLDLVSPPRTTVGDEGQRRRAWLSRDLLGRPVRWVRARILDPGTDCARGGRNRVLVDELVVE